LTCAQDVGYSCHDGTSALCLSSNSVSSVGLNVLETLYFGMLNTSLPDSTVYNGATNDKIICIGPKAGPTIEVNLHGGTPTIGADVRFNVTLPGSISDGSICIFPQKGNITLGDAKPLVDKLINVAQCKTCGNINIDWLANASDTTGGLLKADYTTQNNCIDKCIGPYSYKNTTSASASASASHSSGKRLTAGALFEGGVADLLITMLPLILIFGSSFAFIFRFV